MKDSGARRKLFVWEGSGQKTKGRILVTLCEDTLDPVVMVLALESLTKVGGFIKFCCGKDFMVGHCGLN